MIQPLGMTSNAIAATPVSFSAQRQQNAGMGVQNSADYLNLGTRELSPNVANSRVGQKLDFYA